MTTLIPTAEELMALLRGQRFALTNEKVLQADLELFFRSRGLLNRREHRFDDRSTIDFLFGDLGVEVKIKGAALAILRQCARYCDYPEVSGLLLLTSKSLGLPPTLHGKPVHIFNLSRAWL